MSNTIAKMLFIVGVLISTPLWAATWSQQADQLDQVINSLAQPGETTSQDTYKTYIDKQINSLGGFVPYQPFWECQLLTFKLNDSKDGIAITRSGGVAGSGCGAGGGAGTESGAPTSTGGTGSQQPNLIPSVQSGDVFQ